jgi:hypothetical protein
MARGPVLAVFNLHTIPLTGHQQVTQTPVALFALELGRDIIPFDMHLHYRPNTHSYSAEVAVPFFSSLADHIIALETTNHLRTPDAPGLVFPLRHVIIIPISKLLYHVDTVEKKGTCCVVQWNDWGTTGICRLPAPLPSHCCNAVSGSRFIPHPQSCNVIGVWDFSRAQVRVSPLHTAVSKEVVLPSSISGIVTAALSEDAIVIHEASIVAPFIYPLINIQSIHIHRLSHPRRRKGSIFSSSKVLCRCETRRVGARRFIDNHLAVPAKWRSCICKKWSQRSTPSSRSCPSRLSNVRPGFTAFAVKFRGTNLPCP